MFIHVCVLDFSAFVSMIRTSIIAKKMVNIHYGPNILKYPCLPKVESIITSTRNHHFKSQIPGFCVDIWLNHDSQNMKPKT
jgi:hypothetical protein